MTPKQEAALREYLQEAIVPLIEQVLVKKLGQAMSFAAEQLIQPKPAQQEPVEWGVDWGKAGDQSCVSIIKRLPGGGIEVLATEYGPPASKPWVGLTDEERDSFWKADQMTSKEWDELFNTVEAKLREKNA